MINYEYIIDNTIKYSPLTESLSHISNPEISVSLTPACNRLLIYMISNRGVVLTREAIFSTLWSQYGGTPSNSSLNTYISLIRKAFVNVGVEFEVIKTIPKTGFLFNPDSDIVVKAIAINPANIIAELPTDFVDAYQNNIEHYDSNDNISQEEPSPTSPHIDIMFASKTINNDIIRVHKRNKSRFYYIVGISVILLTIILGVYCLCMNNETSPIAPLKVGDVGTCDILFLPVHAGDSMILSIDKIRYIIKQSGLTCKTGGVFYLYADKRVAAGKNGKVFISHCERRSHSVKNCSDYIGLNLKLPEKYTD